MRNRRLPRPFELPNLTAFVRGYLHEDYAAEYGSATAAAEAFARDASAAERKALARELERIAGALENRSRGEVTRFFAETLRTGWTPASQQELRTLLATIRARDRTGRGSAPDTD
jgi:hypothetical protein